MTGHEPDPASAAARVARYTPALLLIAVALSQIYFTRVEGFLSPSKGGGFAMFATVDKYEHRILRIHALKEGGEAVPIGPSRRLFVRPTVARAVNTAAAIPRPEKLRRLAQLISRHGLFSRDVEAIRVETWKMAFDRATSTARRVKVAGTTVQIGRPSAQNDDPAR